MTCLLPDKLHLLPLTLHQILPAFAPRLDLNPTPRIQDMDLHLQVMYLGIQGFHNHPQDTDHALPDIDFLQGTGIPRDMDYPHPDLGYRLPGID